MFLTDHYRIKKKNTGLFQHTKIACLNLIVQYVMFEDVITRFFSVQQCFMLTHQSILYKLTNTNLSMVLVGIFV